jgi:hypothetical protein
MKAEPQVIATMSRNKALGVVPIILGIGVFVAYLWFDAARDWESFFSDRNSRVGIPTITILWLSMLPIAVKWMRQILSHDARMIWIENGQLVFFYPSYFSAPLTEITALSLTCDFWGRDQARITLRGGSESKFYLTSMSPPPDVIVKRLREICGLPDSAPEK